MSSQPTAIPFIKQSEENLAARRALTTTRIVEIATAGVDEAVQGIGGDPYGGSSQVGLRVPTLATSLPANRYLFMLAAFSVGEGARATIRGYRQLATIGVFQKGSDGAASYTVEQQVTSPFWHFTDGNISWHLQRLGPPNSQGFPRSVLPGGALRGFFPGFAMTPALLFDTATTVGPYYKDLTAYTPPNGGRPWGTSLRSQNPTFFDLRTQWETHGAWASLDIPVEGPDTVALFASVRQTNPSTRATITLPETFYPGGLSHEEQFLLNFPTAVYWRVAGSLIVELGEDGGP